MKRIRSINQSIRFLFYIQTTLLIISAVCLTGCSSLVGKKGITGKPNVLFILADDFGYYDLSCTGSRYYETPHLDRIAYEGTIFTNGYATCQVCSPSRASIMSKSC